MCTILSYSKTVEQEHNHNPIKSHQNQHPPVYICSCGSAQCPKHRTQDLLGCKGAWATLPQGCFGLQPTHLVTSGGIFPHLSLIWVVVTLSWYLQCSQVCTVRRLYLQQWNLLASHSSKLWLFSTCPLTLQLSASPNQYHLGNSYTLSSLASSMRSNLCHH